MNALALVDPLTAEFAPAPTRSVYTDEDYAEVRKVLVYNTKAKVSMAETYKDIAELLSTRHGRTVTISGAKNVVTTGRARGQLPRGSRGPYAKAKPTKKGATVATQPKAPKAPKPFKHGLSTDDFMDFVVQMVYCDDNTMPTRHFVPLMEFRGHVDRLLEALK